MRAATLFAALPVLGSLLACTGILGEDSASAGTDPCLWFRDQDGDGYGVPGSEEATCTAPDGYVENDADCDDQDPSVNPDGTEVCDGVDADEDCDGTTEDDDDSVALTRWHADLDGDGYGDPEVVLEACEQPDGHVDNEADCDDTDRGVNPDGQEVCDGGGGDEDCDGLVDSADDSMAASPLPSWYPDEDGDGFGDPAGSDIVQCDPPAGDWAANADDCDDDDGDVNPGETEVCGNNIDDNCNGSADGCGLSGNISLNTADVRITGSTNSASGRTLCGGGDVNDDGLDDVVFYSGHTSSVGGAYLFYGGASGNFRDNDADVKFSGEAAGDVFGNACAIGDLDGDTTADIVLSDSHYDYSSYANSGRVYLYAGPLSASESTATTLYTNNSGINDYIGTRLVIGDWTGDGRNDLFMSASGLDMIIGDYGAISSSSSRDAFGINEFEGTLDFGGQLAGGGDVDGDGRDDLVAGHAITSADGETGYIYLLSGGFGGTGLDLNTRVDAILEGDEATSGVIGTTMDIRGDLNNDGYADLIAGDSAGDGQSAGSGRAHICFGPWSSGSILGCEVLLDGNGKIRFGEAVAAITDENGDGYSEALIGAPDATGDVSGSGNAYLFRGPFSAGTRGITDADAVLLGSGSLGYAGGTLADAGDFNGDGLSDLLVGAYGLNSGAGAAYVVFGGGL